jgi:hypothetical protein
MTHKPGGTFVVVGDGPDGPIYLDDTGTAARTRAEAKHFRSRIDAEAGLHIAELAPVGDVHAWRIKPADERGLISPA